MADNSYRKVKTTISTKELNQHSRADEDDLNMHYPKKFFGAFGNDIIVKDFRGQLEWQQHRILPNALAIASPTAIPPTQVDGDIYLLSNSTTILNVKDILFQTGNTVRYSFDGTPDLGAVAVGAYMRVKNATKSLNNSTLKIIAVDNALKHVDVTNTLRINNTDDETASPATATIAHTNWDENGEGDWVKYHATDDFWYGTTPNVGALCFIGNDLYKFTTTGWKILVEKNLLSNDIGDVGTDADLVTKLLKTYTIKGGTLKTGNQIIIDAGISYANNANSKRLELKFNGSVILSIEGGLNSKTLVNSIINIQAQTSQKTISYHLMQASAIIVNMFDLVHDINNDIAIELFGKNVTVAVANDIVCKFMSVKLF